MMIAVFTALLLNIAAFAEDGVGPLPHGIYCTASHPRAPQKFEGWRILYDTDINMAMVNCQHWAKVNNEISWLCRNEGCHPR